MNGEDRARRTPEGAGHLERMIEVDIQLRQAEGKDEKDPENLEWKRKRRADNDVFDGRFEIEPLMRVLYEDVGILPVLLQEMRYQIPDVGARSAPGEVSNVKTDAHPRYYKRGWRKIRSPND